MALLWNTNRRMTQARFYGVPNAAFAIPIPVGSGGTGTTVQFTKGSVVFAGNAGVYTQDNANFFWDDTNNRLGLGTNLPLARLHIATDDPTQTLFVNYAFNDLAASSIFLRRSRGTIAAPTAILQTDGIGNVASYGYDGAAFAQGTYVRSLATENWAVGAHGAALQLYTTPNGTTTITERARLDQNGFFGIGITAPISPLHVATSVTNLTGTFDYYANSSSGANFVCRHARGTIGAPTAINFFDSLGTFQAQGYDGAGFFAGTWVRGLADENWNGTSHGSQLQFFTVSKGTTTIANRLNVTSDGALESIGLATTPAVSPTNGGRIYFDSALERYRVSQNAAPYVDLLGVKTVVADSFGAVPDGKSNIGMTVAFGSPNVTSLGGGGGDTFVASDIGKTIWVFGAGAGGGTLKTTILNVTGPTTAVLNTNALTTVTNSLGFFGTDNTTALQAAATAANGAYTCLELSQGRYCVDGNAIPITTTYVTVKGQGPNATTIYQASTTADTISFSFAGVNERVYDLAIAGPGTFASSGAAINFPNGGTFGCSVQRVTIRDCWDGINLGLSGNSDIYLTDVNIFDTVNVGVRTLSTVRWADGQCITLELPGTYTVTIASHTVTADPGNLFTTKDIGKRFAMNGAGAAGLSLNTIIDAVAIGGATAHMTDPATIDFGPATGYLGAPTAVGLEVTNSTVNLSGLNFVAGTSNLVLNPGNGQTVNYSFIEDCYFDSGYNVGVFINPTGTGQINTTSFSNCWFASASALNPASTSVGVGVYATGNGACVGTSFTGCKFVNNLADGFKTDMTASARWQFTGSVFDGNGTVAATYPAIDLTNVTSATLTGCAIRHADFSPGGTNTYGIVFGNCAGDLSVTGCTIRNCATAPISETGTTTSLQTKTYSSNIGFNPKTVTSPAVPLSTVAYLNVLGVTCTVYIATGGGVTVSAVSIDGTVTGMTMAVSSKASVMVPAGGSITLTYAGGTPTWVWIGN